MNETRNEVKIGYSKNPNCRLSSFKTGTTDDLTLLGVIYGTLEDEQKLHKRFAQYKIKGEIFRYEGFLKEYIKDVLKD